MMANAEVELEQLIMKDTHKATKISTNSPCFFSTMMKPSTKELTLLSQRGSRMKWYILTNLACSIDSRTSFRKLTNVIGNKKVNSREGSCLLPSKIRRTTGQTSPAKILIKIRLAHPTCT